MIDSGPEVRANGTSELPEMSIDYGLRAEAKNGLMAQASPVRTVLEISTMPSGIYKIGALPR